LPFTHLADNKLLKEGLAFEDVLKDAKFKRIDFLGKGGFGEVYLVYHEKLKKRVICKYFLKEKNI
jgi:hypothetical protein